MSFFKFLVPLLILLLTTIFDLSSQTFTVTSSEDDEFAYAWDDPDSEFDESSDGICRDEKGRCTLGAAAGELLNIGNGGMIIIDVDLINLQQSIYLPGNVTVLPASGRKVTIKSESMDILSLGGEDNCVFKNIKFIVGGVGISVGSYCILDSIIIEGNNGAAGIAINGDNNQISNSIIGSAGTSLFTGIMSEGSNNTIENCTIEYYTVVGIILNGEVTGNNIRNCTIGDNGSPGFRSGIILSGGECIIENNEIIGNGQSGISLAKYEVSGVGNNIIKNNFIGCRRDLSPAGNTEGIQIISNDNKIEGNIIVWNKNNGIYLNSIDVEEFGIVSGNIISGNSIGGIEDNPTEMPNNQNGIFFMGAVENNVIGADIENEYGSNYIANNLRCGIYSQSISGYNPSMNAFRKNVITNNSNLGIKNDVNTQQSVQPPKFDSLVDGKLYGHDGIAGSKIDIYETDLDNSGSGEGKRWLQEFSINSSLFILEIGEIPEKGISATFTNPDNSTSEFSCNIPMIQSLVKELDVTFIDKITDKDKNKHTITFNPSREITEAKYKVNEGGWQEAELSGNTAFFTVKMGSDFIPNSDNKIYFSSKKCNDFTDTLLIRPKVVRMLEYASPVSDYTTTRNDPELKYKKSSKIEWPNPNLNVSVSIPSITPYIGGIWGLKETGLKFDFEVSSLGTKINKEIELNGGFGLGEKQYDLNGGGNVSNWLFPEGLNTEGNINANLPIKLWEKDENLLSLIPPVQSFCELPIGSEVCSYINSLVHAGVRASITLDLGGNADFHNNGDMLEWQDGELISTTTLSLVGSAGIGDIAGFTVEGRGSGTLTIPFPGLVPSAIGALNFSAYGQIAGVGSISGEKSWAIGGGIINKDNDIDLPQGNDLASDTSYKLITANSPLDANADICKIDEQKHAIVWSETVNSTDSPSRDIKLAIFSNNAVEKTINLTNDEKNNRNPKVVSYNADNLIVSWEYNELPTEPLNSLDIAKYATASEIKYAVIKTSDLSVISVGKLDNPNKFDFSSKLIQGSGGFCRIIWQSSDGSTITGSNDNKVEIYSSEFSSGKFSQPVVLFSESGLLNWNSAITTDGSFYLTYEKDFDNNLLTSDDREIMLFSEINSNKQTKQITNNNALDMMPVIDAKSDNSIDIAYASTDGIYSNQNGEVNNSVKILDESIGFNFAKAKLMVGVNSKLIVWNGARGFSSINQDDSGNWSELKKTKEYDYVNILNSASEMSNGKILAVFQKFDNRSENVLLKYNDLAISVLNFDNTNTNIDSKNGDSETMILFPNPAGEYIEIKNSGELISIYNTLGELMLQLRSNGQSSIRIDLQDLSQGIYIIKSGLKIGKFIKLN